MDYIYLSALISVIVSVVLCLIGISLHLIKWRQHLHLAQKVLCIAVVGMTWHISIYTAIQTETIRQFPYLYNKGIPFYYLIAPCIYYYTLLTLYPKARIAKYWFIHLLPFFVGLIDVIPYALASRADQLALIDQVIADMRKGFSHSYGFIDQKWHYLLKYALAFIYLMAQWRLVFIYEPTGVLAGLKEKRSMLGFLLVYSIHFVFQGGMILNLVANESQSNYILQDTDQLIYVCLFYLIFSIWVCRDAVNNFIKINNRNKIDIHKEFRKNGAVKNKWIRRDH